MPLGLHQNWNAINAPQNAPTGIRAATPSVRITQDPYVFVGDATGGQVPQPPRGRLGYMVTPPPDTYPSSIPDGTGIPVTNTAAQAYRDLIFGPMAQRAAERNNQLQGLFGGTPYQPPVDIQYPGFTQQQQAFNDLSRYLAQYQMDPNYWPQRYQNLRPYTNPNFGRGQDWMNRFAGDF